MNHEFLVIAGTVIASFVIAWFLERSHTKSKQYRCPYCDRYHWIMPSRKNKGDKE